MQQLVTVFGGSGFIGTHVVRDLARQGWRIRVAVRRPSLANHLYPLGDVGQIQVVAADVTRPDTVAAALDRADACVNLVGILHSSARKGFQAVHVEGARNVADAAAKRGITRFVQMSALGADPKARSEYARTKGEGEGVVRRAIPTATILRPSVVFGLEDGLFNRFAAMAVSAPAIPLFGGGKTRFQPVFVGDVADAVVAGLTRPDAAGALYELGGPEVYTFQQLWKMTLAQIDRRRPLIPTPFAVAGLIGVAGDMQALVGMKPALTSDQVLLLQQDNVVSGHAPGLEALGIEPTGVEPILPTYLWRYRRGGQFAEVIPGADI